MSPCLIVLLVLAEYIVVVVVLPAGTLVVIATRGTNIYHWSWLTPTPLNTPQLQAYSAGG